MEAWDKETVLQWIQKRTSEFLKDDNLENFNKADVTGMAFSVSTYEFFKACDLSPGASLVLSNLANEVRERGKFIPRT